MTGTGQAARPAGLAGRVLGVIMARLNADMEHAGVESLGLRGDERVLEIGYGPGIGISALLAGRGRSPGSTPLLSHRQASRRAGDTGGPDGQARADLRIGGVSSLPWPDAAFDGILAVNSAQFWPSPAADTAEVVRVLAPGGSTVIALRSEGSRGHADLADVYERLLTQHGLTVARDTRTMRTGPAIFLTARS